MTAEPVLDLVRAPILAVLSVVDRLRGLPGARRLAPLVPWLAGILFVGSAVLLVLYMSEHSPQRVSMADLASHNLSASQDWFIVTGELKEEASVPGHYRYTLTDDTRADAYLLVDSEQPWPVGHTTVSGRISGYIPPMPPGEPWYASLHADAQLAIERPPPWSAALLFLAGIAILAARRSTYPMFITTPIKRRGRAEGSLAVIVRPDAERPGADVSHGRLELGEAGRSNPTLRTDDGRQVPVRVHSRLTSLRLGELRTVTAREPVIRLLSSSGDLYVGFHSSDERDAVAARLLYGS